MKQSIYIAC